MAAEGGQDDQPPPQPPQPRQVPDSPMEFSQGLRFPCPQRFDGNEKNFEDFAHRLRGYMSMANPRFQDIMLEAQEGGENNPDLPVRWGEGVDGTVKKMSIQLQQALLALCDGPAAKTVDKCSRSNNGF